MKMLEKKQLLALWLGEKYIESYACLALNCENEGGICAEHL